MKSTALPKEDLVMVVFKRVLVLVAIVAFGFLVASCSRKITRVEVVQGPQTCFECHSDNNTFLVAAEQQWEHSKHASGETLNENDSSCKGCHTSEGFVARATGTTPPEVIENPTSIHCFTCHAPHSNGNFGVRWTAVATLQNGASYDLKGGNLCVACHQSRRNVSTYVTARTTLSSRWGPHHGPQGDMLIGSNGYEYAGVTYERTNHRSAAEDGCLDCHMKTTSQNVVGGHSFNMAWGEEGGEILNTAACARCHGEISDFNQPGIAEESFSVQDSVGVLIEDLSTRLAAAGLMQNGSPNSVTTSADSAGAVWNLLIAKEDRSLGIHNPKYVMGLLQSSITYLQGTLPQTTTLAKVQRAMSRAGDRR
jgi:hypothetical protein